MNNKQEEFIDKKISEIRLKVYAGIEEQLAEAKKEIKKAIEEYPPLMDGIIVAKNEDCKTCGHHITSHCGNNKTTGCNFQGCNCERFIPVAKGEKE